MQRRRTLVLAVTLALGAVPAPALAFRRAAHVRPRAFASCARLVGYERTHFAATHGVPETSPRPLSEPSIAARSPAGSASPTAAAPVENAGTNVSGTSFSTTNNQEPGIEEPDVVKTDGSTIFTVEGGTLYAVAAGPAPRLAGSLALGSTGYGAQLLLRGSRLLVISGNRAAPAGLGVRGPRAAGRCRRPIVCALRGRPRRARSVNAARPVGPVDRALPLLLRRRHLDHRSRRP